MLFLFNKPVAFATAARVRQLGRINTKYRRLSTVELLYYASVVPREASKSGEFQVLHNISLLLLLLFQQLRNNFTTEELGGATVAQSRKLRRFS